MFHRNVNRLRGGLVFKDHRLLYHSTLSLRVMKRKTEIAKELRAIEVCRDLSHGNDERRFKVREIERWSSLLEGCR